MALVIEDGTGVTGANSYVTLEEIREYCAQRGISLPSEDEGVEILGVLGFDYVEMFEPKYKGEKSEPNQRTSFPRTGVEIGSYPLPSNEIPWQLKEAQCQAAAESLENDLLPNQGGQAVKREKVDVLEVEYAEAAPVLALTLGAFPKVDLRLKSLLAETTFPRVKVTRR